jgi:hypothetical protein
MSRGSKPGERRGGRQRATPNRRTILTDRILAAASAYPTASRRQLILTLAKDQALPADIRMAIARKSFTARPSGKARAAISAAMTDKTTSREPVKPIDPRALVVLFGIAQDVTASPAERRKAAAEAAKHFLPKTRSNRRWGYNAIPDKHKFAIDPDIAREYRDAEMQLRNLVNSQARDVPAIVQKMNRLRARMEMIQRRLQCPSPENYGLQQFGEDDWRLRYFMRQRDLGIALTEEEDAEEAHLRARFDSFMIGPQVNAHHHLKELEQQERVFKKRLAKPLSRRERNTLRLLRQLYSHHKPCGAPKEELSDIHYHPFRDAPLAEDGNLYPPGSKLRPAPKNLDEDDFVEFADCPPILYGHPEDPRSTDPDCPRGEPVPDTF